MLTEISELYSRLGESLENIGIDETVLPINKVSEVLKLYYDNNKLILGGDIYVKKRDGTFEPYYANWYYEGKSVKESIIKAENYLKQFKKNDLYVSFVLE